MSSNLETVQSIYAMFGAGDVPGIIAKLSPDVAWERWADNTAQVRGVPWMRGGTGPDAVLAFFGVVGADFEIAEFNVLNLMEGGNQVAATFIMDATIRSTGKHFRDEEMHLWTFGEDGRVTGLRHYTDTAKHIAAANLA